MKTVLKIFAAAVAVVVSFAICVLVVISLIFRVSYPPQPKLGYKGDWRVYSVLGVEERPLPHAAKIWADYSEWKPRSEFASRFYVASLGGASRQKNFQASHYRGDTPMGAQDYTDAEFYYEDAHYGALILSWTLRGKHNADFLKFDDTFRFYQLVPYGNSNDVPPKLAIQGIEGVRPEFPGMPQSKTNVFILSKEELEAIRKVNQPFKLNVQ